MTSRYAHIQDATMKDKLAEYLKGTLIDVSGKVVAQDGVNDTADLQWFTRNVLAQALTNGYCAIPIVAGPCPHPNACLNCAHIRTDATFLEVHRAELRETASIIAKADANGRGATERNELAEADKPHLHRYNTGGSSWLGTLSGLKRSAQSRGDGTVSRATWQSGR